MKILVAGAGGYLGIPLVAKLLTLGHDVVAFDRYFFGMEKLHAGHAALAPEYPALHVVRGDTRQIVPDVFAGCDAVVDLAGLSNDACGDLDVSLTGRVNVSGGFRVLSLARGGDGRRPMQAPRVRRYVYASSASVYGHGPNEPLDEVAPLAPLTEYAKTKETMEGEILRFPRVAGFEPVVLRNATLFGPSPRMRWDLVVNVMTMRAWRDGLVYLMGGGLQSPAGTQWRPLLHVDDAAGAIVAALTAPAEAVAHRVWNVAACNMQVRDVASLVKTALPATQIHEIPDGPDRRDYRVNAQAFVTATCWAPVFTVADGVGQIIDGLKDGTLRPDDPTCYTVQWYKSILEWERRLADLAIDGHVLT